MIISKPANIQHTGIVVCKPALFFKECRAYIISPGTLKLRTRTLEARTLDAGRGLQINIRTDFLEGQARWSNDLNQMHNPGRLRHL